MWALIVALVGGLVYLIFFRVWLEVIAMLFRIGENTTGWSWRSAASRRAG